MNDGQQPASTPTGQPQNGLSITSLVLGITALGCSIFTGIPAIITGHIAYNRARKQPAEYGGAGMAIAGMVLGYASIALLILIIPIQAALLLPALAKAKQRAQTIQCVNNMKQIGLAARTWSNDNKEVLPPDFISMKNELNLPKILVCPADKSKTPATDWSLFNTSANVSYEFLLPGSKEADVLNQTVFRCPIHGSIGLGDGSVQQIPNGGRR